jgi:hypothetical protein
VFCNPVVRRICIFPNENHAHVRISRRPNWSRAVGDHENVEPKTRRHAVDLGNLRRGGELVSNIALVAEVERLAGPPRDGPMALDWGRGITGEADSPLEGAGFEPPVPLAKRAERRLGIRQSR